MIDLFAYLICELEQRCKDRFWVLRVIFSASAKKTNTNSFQLMYRVWFSCGIFAHPDHITKLIVMTFKWINEMIKGAFWTLCVVEVTCMQVVVREKFGGMKSDILYTNIHLLMELLEQKLISLYSEAALTLINIGHDLTEYPH